ncbi:MAG: nucleotidyl transferase AbiEii/AbiGii toxin family protein, partial [Clostridiales bacterium]|nr:nucleotidyl transferase AbiEii/AbiGii toxin family protein [Clostridiales bacterium]
MSSSWRVRHGQIILDFITFLNTETENYILKGGTALYLCYNLDRFSEDIDLDGRAGGLAQLVEKFCNKNGYIFRIVKNTETVERCMINYG